jgi:hypothetical protein
MKFNGKGKMRRRIEIGDGFFQVDEDPNGSLHIDGHPELTVRRLGAHVIEVFNVVGKSLGCFRDENAT